MTDVELLARLSLEEKVSLLSGRDTWSLPPIPAIGLESIVMTDGPTGVKHRREEAPQSNSIPCGSALAATWNPGIVEEIGSLLGETARAKGVHVLLAPTTNIVRSPLAGRAFECYSEDPLLSGWTAAAYVRGVQREGVAATVKHFVCNDAETHRLDGSVEVDEQTLRELYLLPFELAVDAGAWAVMAAYNKLRGTYLTAHPILDDVLRAEWGFGGVVVSDWGAVHDTLDAGANGLDVEMPGPPAHWGERLLAAVRSGAVPEGRIDAKVLRILRLARRTGALGGRERGTPRPAADAAALLRRAAAESFVLLKNTGGLLPLPPRTRVALLGPLAALPPLQGGGSSNVGAADAGSPLDALRSRTIEVVYEPGYVPETMPRLDLAWLGAEGFTIEALDENGVVHTETLRSDRFAWPDAIAGHPLRDVTIRFRATLTPPSDGEYAFGVDCAGAATLRVDGQAVLELAPEHELDWSALHRTASRGTARVSLERGRPVSFELEYRMHPGPIGEIGLVTLRARPPAPADVRERAMRAAAGADVAVVVAGLGDERESEGFDRETLELPAEQLQLIADVVAANPATIVVVQAGAPVLTDWAEHVPAVLLVWYAGDELGDALADGLLGVAEPGGRLPVTFPARPEDAPVLDPGPDDREGNEWHYREGLLVGYRHYDRAGVAPAFCFGHGLGYTRFAYEELRVENAADDVLATVRVRNTGARRGKTVVQLYVDSQLRAFRSLELDPGASQDVRFTLDTRAFSHWDPARGGWAVAPGPHELAVGSSSRRLHLRSSAAPAGNTAVSPRSTRRASTRSSVADDSGPQPSPSSP